MQKQAADPEGTLREILAISRDLHLKATEHGRKLDEVHAEVTRTGALLAALRDNVKAVEAAVRHRPQWLLVFAVGALLGASLLLHALRLSG